jgi:hypothetical protein
VHFLGIRAFGCSMDDGACNIRLISQFLLESAWRRPSFLEAICVEEN